MSKQIKGTPPPIEIPKVGGKIDKFKGGVPKMQNPPPPPPPKKKK